MNNNQAFLTLYLKFIRAGNNSIIMIAKTKFIFVFSTLVLGFFTLQAAKVDTISIYSAAMKKSLRCVVVLPSTYAYYEDTRFPVVYLLHGYSGNYANWISKVPSIARLADRYNMMIVCPEGGYSSWYFDSPVDPGSKYKTYIGQEVPAYIDSVYRTLRNRLSRAVAGLSMGGHGALFLAWSYPQTFGAAGSMSGAVDLVPWKEKYDLEYTSSNYGGSAYGNSLEVQNKNQHYLNIINLGIGYERALTNTVEEALGSLKEREARVLRLYFGLEDGRDPMTLEEIGSMLGITRERVRQIKEKALVRLRHASRARYLETFTIK